ncbi:hypothetical protein [Streptomyces sp. NPDC058861]|uniref:hypothetical protein n=1 Tax=Streptomyces sp. NPDC058861 TaxID=3346653 RepID=UPI0036A29344
MIRHRPTAGQTGTSYGVRTGVHQVVEAVGQVLAVEVNGPLAVGARTAPEQGGRGVRDQVEIVRVRQRKGVNNRAHGSRPSPRRASGGSNLVTARQS